MDSAGNPIHAQGGNVQLYEGTYYWVGADLANPKSINLYSSTDLTTWTLDKALLTQATGIPGDTLGDLTPGNWLGRPQLTHNPTTGNWVLDFEVPRTNSAGTQRNAIAFATSPTIDGTYSYLGSILVNGNTVGDHSVFVDGPDAYLVYVGDNGTSINATQSIAKLNSSWTGVASITFNESNYDHHEAPAIIKVGSTYHWFASGMYWWAATATAHRSSTSLASWGAWTPVATVPASSNSFGTQFEQIIPIVGSTGTSYLYNGDRYSQFYSGNDKAPGGIGRNAWYPLMFSGNTPTLVGATDVRVDAAAGTLDYNYVANGRFDQDIAGNTIPQWSTTGYATGVSKVQNTASSTTNRQLTQSASGGYSAWASQQITLPAGTYTFKADTKSSGGETSAYLVVKNYGGSEIHLDLAAAQSSWQTKTTTFTVPTATVITIGVWSSGTGGQWLNVDNVSIWRN
ncbi:family 43 glycosylhydrolase [Leifsonia shinshuensis]|uniref:family 43 glycosylhydrolase n=1 Tax=Leifsonia shinshuensis TaxID=150026 RepID=UPI00285D501C|nr:family 43 glycosylhydrolase [Leifsonia shinshuensis]MDR6972679.1 hypothetical protein [Leifsonia shinshuensis]